MSDLMKISEDIGNIYRQWAAMLRDRDRCLKKIENLQSEISIAESHEQAHSLAAQMMMMNMAKNQYEQQIERFPSRIADLRSKLTYLVVAPEEFTRHVAVSNC